jgi:Ca-activated chloride channel homolog
MRYVATTAVRCVVILAAIAPVAVLARRQAPQVQTPPVFASAVVGVRVDVLVADASTDRPIGGLEAGDFELRDNGVVQHVEVSDLADMPVNVVLAFDASGSIVGKRLTDLQLATHRLLGDLQPADRVALTTFNHAVSPRLALGSDARSVAAVVDALAPSGATSLIDGIYVSLMSAHAETGRSFVLVCTDGRDTASWLTPDELLESARRAPAVVYVVASSGARKWSPLRDVTNATGGRLIEIESSDQIAGEFQKILKDFRSRYVLTFTPTGVERGGYHRLDVRVKRGQTKVTARPGYF